VPSLDYIAAITQHIPEQSFQLVRYYGWYSNRMRGDRKKLEQEVGKGAADGAGGIEIIDIAEFRPTRIPSPMWRECIKKVWEELIRKRPPPRSFAAAKLEIEFGRNHEPFEDTWPGYDEPWVDVHSL
jgi:hypothetical protein